MNQIKKNFIYNIMYQILILILPLITVPYVSRILNTDGVGTYSYTYSIVYYFMIVAMLGINNYGNRTIAKCKDDKEKLSRTFWSIYLIQFVLTALMIIVYLISIMLFFKNYKLIAIIQILNIFSVFFDINWFFFGLEKFKITVIRSTILKLLSVILIFSLVKTSDDLFIYTLIMAGSTLLSQMLLIPFVFKEIKFVKPTIKNSIKHLKPILILFIPVIAVSLFKIMDKIMLGIMTNVSEVGLYEQAEKITGIPLGIMTALGTVMMPRISNLIANKDFSSSKKYINKSIKFVMFMAFPICFGLICISENFVPMFLGQSFAKSSILLNYLVITILFISFANVIRTQYLIPNEMDRDYIISAILGAIVNLVINYLLIPKYQSVGACIGTIAAELFVMIYQIYAVRKELPIKKYIIEIIPFLIKAIIMFIIIYSLKFLELNNMLRIVLQVTIGVAIYGLLNIKYINSIINIKTIFKRGGKNENK